MSNIVLINGSLNPNSNTKKLIVLMSKLLEREGLSSEIIDIDNLNLPLFNPATPPHKDLVKILTKFMNTKAFIIGSPEYHGGYSGALKNFIDHLNGDVFSNKPIGLIASSGGIKAGTNTLNGLRLVFRNLHALVIPQQLAISSKEINDNNLSPECKKRLIEFANEFIHYTKLMHSKNPHSIQ
ncbi:NADPH-dependent FMN reductase [Peribacillus sp. NPDC097295]|uniref:NADPH-dependent FMN reductase n=1 Tax=Peribacillus sp. NPDC097295 TaxID=3364402 RepID=UPI0037F96456